MGPENFGVYSLIISVVTILNMLVCFGLPTILLKEISRLSVKKNWSKIKGLIIFSFIFVISASVLVSGSKEIIVYFYPIFLENDNNTALIISFILVPVLSLTTVFSDALRGMHKLAPSQLASIIKQLLFLSFIIFIAVYYYEIIDVANAMRANLIASFIALFFLITIFFRNIPSLVKASSAKYDIKYWLFSAFPAN